MGQQEIAVEQDHSRLRAFMRALLSDLHALEVMLETGRIESGVRRIGAEQEMFLVFQNMKPAPIASQLIDRLKDQRFTTELAKFNFETNLPPLDFQGRCFHQMETMLKELVEKVRHAAHAFDADVLLTGILPTLTLSDLNLNNLTDVPRYHELNRTLSQLRKSEFVVHIKGLDEIHIAHDNMMLEACNTSFQVHIQVDPDNYAAAYNLAQAMTAPVLAVSVNSPVLFGQKLWAETRLALFQHSVDERSRNEQARNRVPRVGFGTGWVQSSILEIFRQNIARFRVIITHLVDEDPQVVLSRGEAPLLSALRLHNGTVWRWNRPCYGILNGKPHLRIENRVLPAGPSIVDEIANAAFFLGLMVSAGEEYGRIDHVLSFDDATGNFYAAARHGLNAVFHWVNGETIPARDLVLNRLLPLAATGLKNIGVDSGDVDRYLGIVEERVRSGQTGAQWALKSLSAMSDKGTPAIRNRALAAAILKWQNKGEPVHHWPLAEIDEIQYCFQNYRTVGQFMSTDLYTVHPDDLIDLVASIMHWERIRHVPVEDADGRLVGLVSQRDLLRLLAQASPLNRSAVPVRTLMKKNPITVSPETPTLEAVELMRQKKVGCLLVVRDDRLVGMITVYDLLEVSGKLLEEALKQELP